MKNQYAIGVLGGMGTYATIHLFQQYAEVFPAEKEWERPRIIIDNRCTMPSRVRAFLYNENVDKLVNEMVDSMQILVNAGCNRIILACNTSHLFLPRIYEKVPDLENKVIHIITNCVNQVTKDGIKKLYLLGSEGTIDSNIYHNALNRQGIECLCPEHKDYYLLRDCIEAVKQNKYSYEIETSFLQLVNRCDACILGCTELPILYEKYKDNGSMFQEGHEVAKVLSRAELLELSKAKKQEILRKAKMEREMVYSKRREYLINLRKNWGLSQEKFGKLIGKSYCQISFYECGRNGISDLLWNRIVELDGKQ